MKFYGELLIFVLLLLTNGRVFFVKHTRRDPLVSLAPLTFLLALAELFSWKIDIPILYALVLSFLVLLSNFHAMIRFGSHLYVDHYSVLMKFWSIITMILSAIGLITTIVFAPVELNGHKLGVTETEYKYTGSFSSGLTQSTPITEVTGSVFEYTMLPDFGYRSNVVIFVPDKRADTFNYRPYLQLLSKSGFTVCSADFYTKDNRWIHSFSDSKYLRRITMTGESYFNNQDFMSRREFYTFNIKQELNALLPILREKYGPDCKFFLVSDVMGNTAISDYALQNPELISGTFYLDSIEDYETPGYGIIHQTDPFTAFLITRKRDKSLDNINKMVSITSNNIKGAILKK